MQAQTIAKLSGQQELNKMKIRELRALLFNLDNQDMTIKELRSILFQVENQDKELTNSDMLELDNMKEDSNEN